MARESAGSFAALAAVSVGVCCGVPLLFGAGLGFVAGVALGSTALTIAALLIGVLWWRRRSLKAPTPEPSRAMPRDIGIEELDRLLAASAQLVEVLPAAEFGEEHLPGAINVPLRRVSADGVAGLDRSRPVVVYCWDSL